VAEDVSDEEAEAVMEFIPLIVKFEAVANHLVDRTPSIVDLALDKLKYCNSHCVDQQKQHTKLGAIITLGCLLRWGSVTEKLFSRYELLPFIIKKRLADTADSKSMLELASIFIEGVKHRSFCKSAVDNGILEQLVGLAFTPVGHLPRPAKNRFKSVLLTLAVEATQWDRQFAVRNNISAVLVEILKQGQEVELIIQALECIRDLLAAEKEFPEEI